MPSPLLIKPTAIEITNFRKFDHQRVTLSDITVLYGVNGSGKSTIIDAVALPLAATIERFLLSTESKMMNLLSRDIHLERGRRASTFPCKLVLEGSILGEERLAINAESDARLGPGWLPFSDEMDRSVSPRMHDASSTDESIPVIARFTANRTFRREGFGASTWANSLQEPSLRRDGYRGCLDIGTDSDVLAGFGRTGVGTREGES